MKAPSAQIAALHLQGLLEAGYAEPLLFGGPPLIDKEEGVRSAIAAYLLAYVVHKKL